VNPDVVVLEHPWLVDFVGNRPFIYDAHNAETLLAWSRFDVEGPEFLHIRELERRAVQGARAVTYCSERDAEVLQKMFGDFHGVHVPNGVVLPVLDDSPRRNVLLFVGGVYQPNVDAARRLVKIAPQLPDFHIVIVGGCGEYVVNTEPNVELVGHVSDDVLDSLMRTAKVFVNLVTEGSGTHLKVGRALAYGVPVITSQIGARGYSSPIVTDNPVQAVKDVVADWGTFSAAALEEATTLQWDDVVAPMRELLAG